MSIEVTTRQMTRLARLHLGLRGTDIDSGEGGAVRQVPPIIGDRGHANATSVE